MKVICKYDLHRDNGQRNSLVLHEGAKILSVGIQGGLHKLWAEVDTNKPKERRYVTGFYTGQLLPENLGKFIGTVIYGGLVYHYYETN